MHFRTYLKEKSRGKSGQNFYGDGMVEHDGHVGLFLDKLDQLGLTANTIVLYSTDNGPHYNTWPDAAISPYRSEKNTSWEGAYRVPAYVRWPGKFPAGKSLNGIVAHEDWLPTLLAAAGVTDIQNKLKTGYFAGSREYRVHVDGYDMLPYFMGQVGQSPRDTFWYITDDGGIAAVRYEDWKVVFLEQRARAGAVWIEPFVPLRAPKLFNLRWDPYERADQESNTHFDWVLSNNFVFAPIQALAAEFLGTFKEFPPRQKPGSFNLDRVMEKLTESGH